MEGQRVLRRCGEKRMTELPPIHDEAVKQAQWLWDVSYKHAVHSLGINDYSKLTFDEKRKLDITHAVIFKAMNSNVNSIRQAKEFAAGNKELAESNRLKRLKLRHGSDGLPLSCDVEGTDNE